MTCKKCAPKPSPGPWKFIEKPRKHGQWSVRAANGFSVVGFPGPDSGHPELDEQDRVNARLIAAAPALLAELKRIHKIVASEGGVAMCGGCLVPKEIDRVIARAEGRR